MQTDIDNQTELLIRILKDEIFRFIIIQYNHNSVIVRVKNFLEQNFTNRIIKTINTKSLSFDKFMAEINLTKKGILLLENFNELLNNESFYPALNQRRDLIAQSDVSLIVFLPAGANFLNECIKKIPDLWSFRSGLFDFSIDETKEKNSEFSFSIPFFNDKSTAFTSKGSKTSDYNRLKKRIKVLEPTKENLPLLNNLYSQLLDLARELAFYKEGLKFSKEFLELAEQNNYKKEAPEILGAIYNYLGLFYKDLGYLSKAKELMQKAMDSAIKNFGEEHPSTASCRSNLAGILKDLGDLNEAKELMQKAMDSAIKNFGEEHPSTASSRSNLALILKDLGNLNEAKELMQKAMDSAIKNFGEEHPSTASSRSNLALILKDLGDLNNAKELITKAYDFYKNKFGEEHPSTKIVKRNMDIIFSKK